MIDTHCHLYDEAFAEEEDEAVARALEAGVSALVLPDIDSRSRGAMSALAARHPGVAFPCAGLHPTEVGEGWKEEYELAEQFARKEKVVAIGEIGIDLYWSREFACQQKAVFGMQLDLACELDLPVIIHNREATEVVLEEVRKHNRSNLRGVLHAFTGSVETAREFGRMGDWYFGIGGVVTFKKASIGETVKELPLDRILLETDCPYLTPVPFRGHRNESSYLPYIAATIASKLGKDISEVDEITSANARRLFGI